MTIRPGDRVVFRNLPKRTDGTSVEDRLPPCIGLVVSATDSGIVVRLRIGGIGSTKYAPKARVCPPDAAVRLATPRENFAGLVLDPLVAAA